MGTSFPFWQLLNNENVVPAPPPRNDLDGGHSKIRPLDWPVFYIPCDIFVAVAVIVTFVLCWAPFHAQRLMTVHIADDQWTPLLLYIESQLFYVSGTHTFRHPHYPDF